MEHVPWGNSMEKFTVRWAMSDAFGRDTGILNGAFAPSGQTASRRGRKKTYSPELYATKFFLKEVG